MSEKYLNIDTIIRFDFHGVSLANQSFLVVVVVVVVVCFSSALWNQGIGDYKLEAVNLTNSCALETPLTDTSRGRTPLVRAVVDSAT